jgi:hypothetical protein
MKPFLVKLAMFWLPFNDPIRLHLRTVGLEPLNPRAFGRLE